MSKHPDLVNGVPIPRICGSFWWIQIPVAFDKKTADPDWAGRSPPRAGGAARKSR